MIFLPTTHFKVLDRTQDFPLDFQITNRTDYIVTVLNSNSETYSISPLVIEHRLRQGKIRVIAFPAHPSHFLGTIGLLGQSEQCSRCMIKKNEESIQFECALSIPRDNDPIPYANEACAECGTPLDLHLGVKDPPVDTPHALWGDRNRCRTFVRCDPPRAAYGVLSQETYRSGVQNMPGGNTICPACVLEDARIRLCVTHLACPTCGNPRVVLCPTCLEPKV
jgi:hypothetical protein